MMLRLMLTEKAPEGGTPAALPPSFKEVLDRLAAHEDWTKKQVAEISARLAALPPAEQKKEVERIVEKATSDAPPEDWLDWIFG